MPFSALLDVSKTGIIKQIPFIRQKYMCLVVDVNSLHENLCSIFFLGPYIRLFVLYIAKDQF